MPRPHHVVPGVLVLALAASVAHGEGPLGFWSPRDLEGMTKRRWEAASNRTTDEILKLNLELKTWPEACEVVTGAKEYAGNRDFLMQVTEQLTNPAVTRLEKTYRLIQWDRIHAGDLVFPGRGFVVLDDVFTVAGRANWILRTVTEKSFGFVKPGAEPEELAELQRTWRSYLEGKTPKEYEPPYTTSVAGLEEELFDPFALQVIVESLAPNPKKDALVEHCLGLVGRKELPTLRDDPARLCDPDVTAMIFLHQATDGSADMSAEAWVAWWHENHDRLHWNAGKGKFETGASTSSSN